MGTQAAQVPSTSIKKSSFLTILFPTHPSKLNPLSQQMHNSFYSLDTPGPITLCRICCTVPLFALCPTFGPLRPVETPRTRLILPLFSCQQTSVIFLHSVLFPLPFCSPLPGTPMLGRELNQAGDCLNGYLPIKGESMRAQWPALELQSKPNSTR